MVMPKGAGLLSQPFSPLGPQMVAHQDHVLLIALHGGHTPALERRNEGSTVRYFMLVAEFLQVDTEVLGGGLGIAAHKVPMKTKNGHLIEL